MHDHFLLSDFNSVKQLQRKQVRNVELLVEPKLRFKYCKKENNFLTPQQC